MSIYFFRARWWGAVFVTLIAIFGLTESRAANVGGVEVVAERTSSGNRLIAVNDSLAPITASIRVTGSNLELVPPILVVLAAQSRQGVADLRPADSSKEYNYRSEVIFRYGDYTARPAAGALYRLPFEDGQSFPVSQTDGGVLTTHDSGHNQYAIDFTMPEGSLVLAAREGVVVEVVEHFTEGGNDRRYLDQVNWVSVLHDDGTIADYAHLAPRSAMVLPGDYVYEGDKLGLSGNTGYSTGPHLHFEVRRTVVDRSDRLFSQSVPVTFYSENPDNTFRVQQGVAVTASYGASATGAAAHPGADRPKAAEGGRTLGAFDLPWWGWLAGVLVFLGAVSFLRALRRL